MLLQYIKVTGRAVADCVVKTLGSGENAKQLLTFKFAYNTKSSSSTDKEGKPTNSNFVEVQVWNPKLIEILSSQIKKATQLMIEGEPIDNRYLGEEGKLVHRMRINAERVTRTEYFDQPTDKEKAVDA